MICESLRAFFESVVSVPGLRYIHRQEVMTLRSAILFFASLAFSIIAAESALRVLGFDRDFLGALVIPDTRYGHRVAPLGTTDSNLGFRDPKIPIQADIVAIGDSQTYGVSASATNSWPAQLQALLQRKTYNLGIGGYGPVQYDFLWDDYVARLAPSTVIVGLYPGNDISDSFNFSSLLPLKDPLRPDNPPPLPTIADAETRIRPLEELRGFLYRHSILYNMGKLAISQFASIPTYANPDEFHTAPGMEMQFEEDRWLDYIRLDNPENVVGLRITLGYLERLATKCRATGHRCFVVLIPTKERVMRSRITSAGKSNASFEALWSTEDHIRSLLLAAARSRGLRTIDVLPAMALAADSADLYPVLGSHPNWLGYGVISTAVAKEIRESNY